MADDHWGLLGDPPSVVDVAVRAPPPGPLTRRIAALRAYTTRARLLAVVPAIVATAVVVALATRSGGIAVSGGAPVGGAVRCINASTLCMTRGSFPRRTAPGPS